MMVDKLFRKTRSSWKRTITPSTACFSNTGTLTHGVLTMHRDAYPRRAYLHRDAPLVVQSLCIGLTLSVRISLHHFRSLMGSPHPLYLVPSC